MTTTPGERTRQLHWIPQQSGATVIQEQFLGESHWNSTGKPLLLVDPDCLFIEQLPGSDIQTDVCQWRAGGQSKRTNLPFAAHRQEICQTQHNTTL